MMVLTAPALLVAGALAALVPLAVHLIRRRPSRRAPLPTLRFLRPDPRTAVRLGRPTDLPLLLLRAGMLLLLGAGLARPSWVPARAGTADVVLLDRSVHPAAWAAAVGEARRVLLRGGADVPGTLVLFDSVAEVVEVGLVPSLFDSLGAAPPGAPSSDLAVALRALPAALGSVVRADSARVTLVSPLLESSWSGGFGAVRAAGWPGAIRVERVPQPSPVEEPPPPPAGPVVVVAREGGVLVATALEAVGRRVRRAPDAASGLQAAAVVVADAEAQREPWLELARGGAVVVLAAAGGAGEAGGDLWFGPDLRLAGAGPRAPLAPVPGARLLAAWHDGSAAATARQLGEGCLVEIGTGLEAGDLPFQPGYPAALDRLVRGCEPPSAGSRPLDRGALALLRGAGSERVSTALVRPDRGGIPFGRWLLAAALAVALVETTLAYRRRRDA
jgi:hypothetical protein